MEDAKIIDLYFTRSEDALSETEKKYGSYLRQVAGRLLRSREDTEEILEDTWLAAWNSIPPQRPRKLLYYLAKITRNLSLNRLDYRNAQCRNDAGDVLLSELEECIPDPKSQDSWEAREIGQALNGFLGTISRADRSLFLNRYFYGYTLDELSDRYGLAKHKLKYRLRKTRTQLAAYLQQEGIGI